jgi:transcriptional regulator with XRE-family HTH domain
MPTHYPYANPRTIGRRVRALRLGLGLTQYELSRRSGVRESRMSEIERGVGARPNNVNLVKLAEALGTTVEALTLEEPTPVRVVASEAQPVTLNATHVTVVHRHVECGRCSGSTYAQVR